MVKQATDAGADLNYFFGGVDGSVVDVQRAWKSTFIECGAKGFNEGVHIFRQEELAVAADPRRIIQKGDEAGLDLA